MIRATEHFVFGYRDPRAINGSPPFAPLGDIVFPFEAELRGWCMALYRQSNPGLASPSPSV